MRQLSKGLVSIVTLVALAATSLFAADTSAAMVYARGTAWVNGAAIPKSSAIFPGDLVQTKSDSIANINQQGTSVTVLSDSLQSLAAHIGDVTVAPANGSWTEFQVADVDGNVKIIARKGDLQVSDQEGTTTVPSGQETTREETHRKHKKREGGGAVTAAQGSILDSPSAICAGTAIVGGVTAWVLLQGDNPASPTAP